MKYKTYFLVLFTFGVGFYCYLETRNVAYNFDILAVILGAIAGLLGSLAILIAGFIIWGGWGLARNKKLPEDYFNKFYKYAFWFLAMIMLSKLLRISGVIH